MKESADVTNSKVWSELSAGADQIFPSVLYFHTSLPLVASILITKLSTVPVWKWRCEKGKGRGGGQWTGGSQQCAHTIAPGA